MSGSDFFFNISPLKRLTSWYKNTFSNDPEYMSLKDPLNVEGKEPLAQREPAVMSTRDMIGFFTFGLINNTSYVIMIAGAKEIDASMVGVVYLSSEIPGILTKLSIPYWAHLVSYRKRVFAAAFLMALSFVCVAVGGLYHKTWLQLMGVGIGAVQGATGEASMLALSSFYNPSRKAITMWSSGTGFAGIFGYAWVVFFGQALKCTFSTTLFTALGLFPAAYIAVFELVMGSPSPEKIAKATAAAAHAASSVTGVSSNIPGIKNPLTADSEEGRMMYSEGSETQTAAAHMAQGSASLSFKERMYATAKLWPYMVPIATVYFAEYLIQAGVWSAMGFPVTDPEARKMFYQYANFTYQAGVVISRSSGTLWTPTRLNLWVMPAMQCGLLIFSIINAYRQLWYSWSILALSFTVGLLGGAVYVGGFSLIAMESPIHLKEFNLGAASLANAVGIASADVSSIYLQKAIYKHYGIQD